MMINSAYGKTIKNTTELTGTVANISIIDLGKDTYVQIYVDEYLSHLHIAPSVCLNIDLKNISDLQVGDTVTFRIENDMLEILNTNDYICSVFALKTAEKEIFTLNQYNEYIKHASFPARLINIFLIIILIIFSTRNVILLKIKKHRLK